MRTSIILITTVLSALFLVLGCAPSEFGSAGGDVQSCFDTGRGIKCVSTPGDSDRNSLDVDGDGKPDSFVCRDADSDSDSDSDGDGVDGDGVDDDDSNSDSDTDCGPSDEDSDSDSISDLDGDGDGDGIPDADDCDCVGAGVPPQPEPQPEPIDQPIPPVQ